MDATGRHPRLATLALIGMILLSAPVLAAQGYGPGGATAKCQDGDYVRHKSQSNACADHEGLAVWYGVVANGPQSASQQQDTYATLEGAIAQESPNTVVRADLQGTIEDRFHPDSAEVARYGTFTIYLDRVREESACRKLSAHYVLCPASHYGTNVPAFLPLMAF